MIKRILISFIFLCIPCFVLAAELPSWAKGGSSAKYPQEEFLTAVGKGTSESDAVTDAHRNIIQNVINTLTENGIEKVKINISPTTLLKAFEKGYSFNDKDNKTYYVLGVVDKNMLRINIEDDLYAAERALQYRNALYETSKLSVIPKIKAINELLELYNRRDSVIILKKALTDSIVNTEIGEFEREKLEIERKGLFDNLVYYIETENFDAAKLKKSLEDIEFHVLPELPAKPVSSDKGVAVISCKIQVNKAPDKSGSSFDWIADLVLSDAYNEKTVLYSKTAAGDESGKTDNEAHLNASASAAVEMNRMADEFFKSIN